MQPKSLYFKLARWSIAPVVAALLAVASMQPIVSAQDVLDSTRVD